MKTNLWWILGAIMILLGSCRDNDSNEPSLPGEDNYEGRIHELNLTNETAGLTSLRCTLMILTPDSTVITRACEHARKGDISTFLMDRGLKEGTYRLLYATYRLDTPEKHGDKVITSRQFGLGSRIKVDSRGMTVESSYDSKMGLTGSGTTDDPYIISSYDHLMTLAHKVNSDATNALISENTHFKQIADIDMDDACFFVDHRYGWEAIGSDTNLPFRGVYHGGTLKNMWSLRSHSPAVGLFGYIHKAKIDGVRIENGEFTGNFAVGTVAGAAITAGTRHDCSEITNCRTVGSSVTGSDGSLGIGGIIGATDMNARIMLYECHNENTPVEGDYNVGGIIGAAFTYSLSSINNCSNSGRIRSGFSGAGGIVGTSDTIYITSCRNRGEIQGGAAYKQGDSKNGAIGTGGLIGGAGTAFITGCDNSGKVTGVDGVGGVLGSCRVNGDATNGFLYNNAAFRYCSNSADVTGLQSVGGINGEAQFGSFAVINTGKVTGETYVGGIVGNTSIAVAHNAVNTASVNGRDYVSGIVGKTTFGSFALDDNFGDVNGTGHHAGGIVALAGNNTIIHYCGNHGNIFNSAGKHMGGLVGEIGDPREWTGWNIAECVVGAAEIVFALAGPMITFAEHALEESLHAVSLIIKYSEFAFDCLLHATDTVLWIDGTVEIASGESSEEVSASIQAGTYDVANDINAQLASVRSHSANYHTGDLSTTPLSSQRSQYVKEHVDWYATEGNDDIFNDAINETRLERMEATEKVEHTKEIVHQVIGGVCLVGGTVASIGAIVASGGTATAFVVTGMAVGFVGGINAVVKSCSEFENNAVVISQCVNSGDIHGTHDSGSLVGSLQDSAEMRDCLNIGSGTGSEKNFVGHYGTRAFAARCISAGKGLAGYDTGFNGSGAIRKDGAGKDGYSLDGSIIYIDGNSLNEASLYKKVDSSWDIGGNADSRWRWATLSADGLAYPVPGFSEMRKKD